MQISSAKHCIKMEIDSTAVLFIPLYGFNSSFLLENILRIGRYSIPFPCVQCELCADWMLAFGNSFDQTKFLSL